MAAAKGKRVGKRTPKKNVGAPVPEGIRVIFLDRDDVLCEEPPPGEDGFNDVVKDTSELRLYPEVKEALRRLADDAIGKYYFVIVTNQRGIWTGKVKKPKYEDVTRTLRAMLWERPDRVGIEDVYMCPHGREEEQKELYRLMVRSARSKKVSRKYATLFRKLRRGEVLKSRDKTKFEEMLDDIEKVPEWVEADGERKIRLLRGHEIPCTCRKPEQALIERAINDLERTNRFRVARSLSFMVGDRLSDVQLGMGADLNVVAIKRRVFGLSMRPRDFETPEFRTQLGEGLEAAGVPVGRVKKVTYSIDESMPRWIVDTDEGQLTLIAGKAHVKKVVSRVRGKEVPQFHYAVREITVIDTTGEKVRRVASFTAKACAMRDDKRPKGRLPDEYKLMSSQYDVYLGNGGLHGHILGKKNRDRMLKTAGNLDEAVDLILEFDRQAAQRASRKKQQRREDGRQLKRPKARVKGKRQRRHRH